MRPSSASGSACASGSDHGISRRALPAPAAAAAQRLRDVSSSDEDVDASDGMLDLTSSAGDDGESVYTF